jgi:hypothetical protein
MANPLPIIPPMLPQPPGQEHPVNNQLARPASTRGVRHKNFASLYSDVEVDPFQRNYSRVMQRFDPEINNALSHVMLLEQAVSCGAAPQAYLCCSQRQNQVKVYCLHMPSKYVGSLNGQTTPWDGEYFAFLGDLVQGVSTTIDLPPQTFHAIHHVQAYTVDYIISHRQEMGPNGFTPPDENDEEAHAILTRRIMYLPAHYVPLMLRNTGFSLQEVWQHLYPALVNENDAEVCAPLVKWLQAISVGTELPNNVTGPTAIATALTVPLADEALINHRMKILHQALPALNQPSEALEMAITQMAAAVTQNTNENRLAHDEKAARKNTPKLPSDKYEHTLPILLDFLQIQDEVNLPQLWHKWANCTKRQEFQILSDLLHSFTRSADAFSTCAPVVLARLLQDLLQFNFVSDSQDDIKSGLHPFVIADGSAEHRQANLELARTYSHLASGEHALLLADLEALKAKEVASIHLTYFELERNLGMFGNLLGIVLECTHPITQAYRAFWSLLSQGFRMEIQQIIDVKAYVKPAHVLRSVQLVCYSWFLQKRNKVTPPSPEFTSILYKMTLNTYITPHLPSALYRLAYPKPSAVSDTPSLIGSSVSGSSNSSSRGSASSSASVISGLTLHSANAHPTNSDTNSGQGHRSKGTFQANLAPDHALHRLIDSGVRLRDLIGNTTPPQLDNGTPICLSFYCTPGCWSNCSRVSAHFKMLSASEKSRLEDYLKTQMQKWRAARAAPTTSG